MLPQVLHACMLSGSELCPRAVVERFAFAFVLCCVVDSNPHLLSCHGYYLSTHLLALNVLSDSPNDIATATMDYCSCHGPKCNNFVFPVS